MKNCQTGSSKQVSLLYKLYQGYDLLVNFNIQLTEIKLSRLSD